MTLSKLTGITVIFMLSNALCAYIPSELFRIPWGSGESELRFSPTVHNFNSEDSSDDIVYGRGPSKAFIDKNNNVIFASYDFPEIKGFDSSGKYLFSISGENTDSFSQICGEYPSEIYVDSNLQLYVLSFPALPYVPIMTYGGILLQKLYPFADSQNGKVDIIEWSPSGQIYFMNGGLGWARYYNGEITRTGCLGMLASNGYFYRAFNNENYPSTLFIGKYADIDSFGSPGYRYKKTIELEFSACDTLYEAWELPGGDGSKLFVFAVLDSCDIWSHNIWEYDLDFNKLDEVRLRQIEGSDYIFPDPVIGPDGSIYEFRAFNDGLHVIKWTKQ